MKESCKRAKESSLEDSRHFLRIALLGNDPADEQWSILEYGRQLQPALSGLIGARGDVALLVPQAKGARAWLRGCRVGRAAAMYESRYLLYPKLLKGEGKRQIYHILDHGNSWLIRYLDPARTVVTCHDLIPLILRHRGESLWPWVSGRLFRHAVSGIAQAAAILTNSSCTRNDLISRLGIPPDRIHVVPLGLNPGLRPPAADEEVVSARAALGLPREQILLHTGQPVFYKNIEGLLRSFQILLRRGEAVWLVRAGGYLRQGQRCLARRLGVAHRLLELGPLSHEKLYLLYRAADLLVFPSWYEGFGLPPLEAMASGLPVIVSNRGALPETVNGAGLVVDPKDPAQLADAVHRLLKDSVLRLGFRAKGLIQAGRFCWEETAIKTLQIYQALLA